MDVLHIFTFLTSPPDVTLFIVEGAPHDKYYQIAPSVITQQ